MLSAIATAYQNGEVDRDLCLNYRAIVLFGAFTGQRPQATTARLRVGQFRAAVANTKPVIDVVSEQDKIRFQHYCPSTRKWLMLLSWCSVTGLMMNSYPSNYRSSDS
ncbi:MAG: hypothetical protein ACXV4C_08500 [Halobacteriota archaeon]